jgi:hypothetical protein
MKQGMIGLVSGVMAACAVAAGLTTWSRRGHGGGKAGGRV